VTASGKRVRSAAGAVRHYFGATAGNISVAVSLAIPAVMGAVGLASDFAQFTNKHTQLQAAADAAAIAAAKELTISPSNDASVKAAADAFVAATYSNVVSSNVNIDRSKSTVDVEISEAWVPFFAHYLGAAITPVVVKAQAALVGQGNTCVLALDESSAQAIRLDKSAIMKANGCGVYSNSSSPSSLSVRSGASIISDLTCTVGGVDDSGGNITPAATTDCPIFDDPLEDRPEPASGGCDVTGFSVSSGTVTLNPGKYCDGLVVAGTAVATFLPGDYIIEGAPLVIGGNASIVGNHVGFFLEGEEATINFTSNTSISLTGPVSGAMAGILFFEDRGVSQGRPHRINSSNAHTLTGTIYLSRGDLTVDPKAKVAFNSAYTAIIANQLRVSDGPELILNTNYGATDVPVPMGIKSTTNVVLRN
jgi:Flp pilus assembly protein TadG